MTATRSTAANSANKASKATKATKATKKTTKKATAAAAAALAAATKNRSHTGRFVAETPPRSRQPSVEAESESSDSDDTITPSVIEETPPPSSSSRAIKRLEKENAYLKHRLNEPRVHKSRSRKHKSRSRRHRYEYSSSSTDSEEGAGERVSFLHEEGNKPFLSLHERYRAVDIKYFKQIFFGTFRPEHLTRLASTTYITMDKKSSKDKNKDKDDDIQDIVALNPLIRCLEVYCQAIIHFAHPSIKLKLQEALSDYRVRLSDMSVHYTFASIRDYNSTFMTTRRIKGQDDPTAWATQDPGCADFLIRKSPAVTSTKPTNGTTNAPATKPLSCNNFNAGRCVRDPCRYSHICSICQLNHSAVSCPKAHPPASNSNSTPLGNRISKAD